MIAFFGMGLLGSNFVRAALRRGEEAQVWSRTLTKASALEADGAKAFADPADAARGATRVHLTLSDDAAVDEVLERARPGFAPGVVIVDHTTTSPTGTRVRAQRWNADGFELQHAPVFIGPQNALESTGLMLAYGTKCQDRPLPLANRPLPRRRPLPVGASGEASPCSAGQRRDPRAARGHPRVLHGQRSR